MQKREEQNAGSEEAPKEKKVEKIIVSDEEQVIGENS